MSLEARVSALEEWRSHCEKVLIGIEGTCSLILEEQMNLRKEMLVRFMEQDQKITEYRKALEVYQQESRDRFDKIEEILLVVVDRLKK